MQYTIIEDASPYYVRFTFEGLSDAIEEIRSIPKPPEKPGGGQLQREYTQYIFDEETGKHIVEKLGLWDKIAIKTDRVLIVETPPGGGCGIHKDGAASKTGINIPLLIIDHSCITSWYKEEEFPDQEHVYGAYSRNAFGDFYIMNDVYTAIRTLKVIPNEMILMNTDLWHSWDNTKSENFRSLLTLKIDQHNDLTFDQVKELLFK